MKAVEGFSEEGVKDEAELQPLQKLINEAYQEIDKVGLVHSNLHLHHRQMLGRGIWGAQISLTLLLHY